MIGFGELRKKSVAWQIDISAVEKIHAMDWLLYGIGERAALREHLTLRGAAALANAYFENYPRVADLEFARAANLDERLLENELDAALRSAPTRRDCNSSSTVFARSARASNLRVRSAVVPPRSRCSKRA